MLIRQISKERIEIVSFDYLNVVEGSWWEHPHLGIDSSGSEGNPAALSIRTLPGFFGGIGVLPDQSCFHY